MVFLIIDLDFSMRSHHTKIEKINSPNGVERFYQCRTEFSLGNKILCLVLVPGRLSVSFDMAVNQRVLSMTRVNPCFQVNCCVLQTQERL